MADLQHGDPLLEDLLAKWELARLDDDELSAEELASDHPELLTALRDGIAVLKSTDWVLAGPFDATLSDGAGDSITRPRLRLSEAAFIDGLRETLTALGEPAETLLEAHLDGGSTPEEIAHELVEDGLLTAYQAKVLLTHGSTPLLLDRYVILEMIGAGGMGRIYKALHRSMRRVVALKVLPADTANSTTLTERFRREIKTAACLDHPNIVVAHDAHVADDRHFLVMEYVAGQNLVELVRQQGPLSVAQAISIVVPIAEALGQAHQQGIIHRDVKPSNIILSEDGVPKLLDLGIARFKKVAEVDQHSRNLTEDGIPIGTVAYISPEQAKDSKDVDARSDIYSLGCTFYFLLTGKPIFEKSSGVHVVAAHVAENPPRLSDAVTNVPEQLEHLFARMIAKSPNDRYASMAELISALEDARLIDSGALTSIHARPYLSGQHPTKQKGRPSLSTVLFGLVLLAVAVSVPFIVGMVSSQRPGNVSPDLSATVEPYTFPSDTPHLHATPRVREIAATLLDRGARIYSTTASGTVSMTVPSDIPEGYFQIGIVDLTSAGQLEDSIKLLQELPELSELWIKDTSLTEAMVTGIARTRALETIELSGTNLDDAGFEQFIGMPHLRELNIQRTQVNPLAVKRFKGLHDAKIAINGPTRLPPREVVQD